MQAFMQTRMKRCLRDLEERTGKKYKLTAQSLRFDREKTVVGELKDRVGHLQLTMVTERAPSLMNAEPFSLPSFATMFNQVYASESDIKRAFHEFALCNAVDEFKKGNNDFGLKSFRKFSADEVKQIAAVVAERKDDAAFQGYAAPCYAGPAATPTWNELTGLECGRCGYKFIELGVFCTALCKNPKGCNNTIREDPPPGGGVWCNNFRYLIPSTMFSSLWVKDLSVVWAEYRTRDTLMGNLELTSDPVTYRPGLITELCAKIESQ